MNYDKTVGENIRRRREQLGLSQPQLAAKVGLTPKSLSQIENGHTQARRANLLSIAEALGCRPEDLLITLNTLNDQQMIVGPRSAAAIANLKRPATVAEMTPEQLEVLVSRASKRDNTINLENERLKKELEALREAIPQEFARLWPGLPSGRKAACLFFLSGDSRYLGPIAADLRKQLSKLTQSLDLNSRDPAES